MHSGHSQKFKRSKGSGGEGGTPPSGEFQELHELNAASRKRAFSEAIVEMIRLFGLGYGRAGEMDWALQFALKRIEKEPMG